MAQKIPIAVSDRLQILGQRIRIARKRRGWTIAETAEKVDINRNTLNALELGKPGIMIGTYVSVLWVLGLDRTLDAVADPDKDVHGKTLEAARRPQRVRGKAVTDEYNF